MHKPGQDKFGKKAEDYAAKVTQLPDKEQPEHTKSLDVSDMDENYEMKTMRLLSRSYTSSRYE